MPAPEKLKVASLHYYPVKSCAGVAANSLTIDDRGFKDDRGWLVVNENGKFVSQRELPKMALIAVKILDGETRSLQLEAPGMPLLTVPELIDSATEATKPTVTVWKDSLLAIDQGDEAASWFSRYLDQALRLVHIGKGSQRMVRAKDKNSPDSEVNFQDGFPFLIATSASLNELNEKLETKLPMNRFRPNIVIEGAEPFAEDNWKKIRIADVEFEIDSPCARCTITTIDQTDATKGVEPLRTLSKFRNKDNEVLFGQNAIHTSHGIIRVGDEMEVIHSLK